jgi:hypothetical protein
MHGARPVGERTLLDQSVGWIDQDTEPAGDQLAGDGAGIRSGSVGRPAGTARDWWVGAWCTAGWGRYVRTRRAVPKQVS